MKKSLLRVLAVFALLAATLHAGQPNWKHYRNQRWGFSLAYPSDWTSDEGANKAGIQISPKQDGPSWLLPSITIGALVNAHSKAEKAHNVDEIFDEGGIDASTSGARHIYPETSACDFPWPTGA